jgi:hypothetical protein
MALSCISLGCALLGKNKKINDYLFKIKKFSKQSVFIKLFFSVVVYVCTYNRIWSHWQEALSDSLYKELKTGKNQVLCRFLRIYGVLCTGYYKAFFSDFLKKNFIEKPLADCFAFKIRCQLEWITVVSFLFFVPPVIFLENNTFHLLKPLFSWLICIVLYKNNACISPLFFDCLQIFIISMYLDSIMPDFLFIVLKFFVPWHFDNDYLRVTVDRYMLEVKNRFDFVLPIFRIILIIYKMHLLIKLFNDNTVVYSLYYFSLLLFNKGNVINDDGFLLIDNMFKKEEYFLDNVMTNFPDIDFWGDDDKYIINYDELNNDLKKLIQEDTICSYKEKFSFVQFMHNRILLFLTQVICHENKEKQKEFLKKAFDHYKFMMASHAYCGDDNVPFELSQRRHTSCKNGQQSFILQDVLSNPDSPFTGEFNKYLTFEDSEERPLYNKDTQMINYDNITVKVKIDRCKYIKEIWFKNKIKKFLCNIENFLYKNI